MGIRNNLHHYANFDLMLYFIMVLKLLVQFYMSVNFVVFLREMFEIFHHDQY